MRPSISRLAPVAVPGVTLSFQSVSHFQGLLHTLCSSKLFGFQGSVQIVAHRFSRSLSVRLLTLRGFWRWLTICLSYHQKQNLPAESAKSSYTLLNTNSGKPDSKAGVERFSGKSSHFTPTASQKSNQSLRVIAGSLAAFSQSCNVLTATRLSNRAANCSLVNPALSLNCLSTVFFFSDIGS